MDDFILFLFMVIFPSITIMTIAILLIIGMERMVCSNGYTGYETRWKDNMVGCQIKTKNGWVPVDNFIVNEEK